MKYILILLLTMTGLHAARAQTVASSCTAPDSIKMKYMTGADILAVNEIFARDLTYKDSVKIPQNWTDTFLLPMLAIYNAVDLPARDTVVNIYYIEAPYGKVLNRNTFSADTSLFWVKNFKNGIVPCGYAPVDDLLEAYDLVFYHYDGHPMVPEANIYVKSDSNYNMQAVSDKFLSIPGISHSGAWAFTLPMYDITATIHSDRTELTYSYGWGDCMAGCYYRRYWKFIVYPDCSVEYGGSYGDPLSPTHIAALMPEAGLTVSPNPFSGFLSLDNPESLQGELLLYDVLGRQALRQALPPGKSQVNTSVLSPGIYTYRITGTKGVLKTGRVVKQ